MRRLVTYSLSGLATLYWGLATAWCILHYSWIFTKDPAQDPVIYPPHPMQVIVVVSGTFGLFVLSAIGPSLLRKAGHDRLAFATALVLLGATVIQLLMTAYFIWLSSPTMELVGSPVQ